MKMIRFNFACPLFGWNDKDKCFDYVGYKTLKEKITIPFDFYFNHILISCEYNNALMKLFHNGRFVLVDPKTRKEIE